MLRALADEHEFTVFSVEFDNPRPDKIRWVRVPAPLRPLPLLFVVYYALAPLAYLLHRLRTGQGFDLLQTVESKFPFGDVAYTHFCHTSYLRHHWRASRGKGARRLSRYLDHRIHALLEGPIYRRVSQVVVPSKGLATELGGEFPAVAEKIRVFPNAVDNDAFRMPPFFDRGAFRRHIGLEDSDVVFLFVALGHFERKGLPLLFEALDHAGLETAKLLVVGGTDDLIKYYRGRCKDVGLQDRVLFAGHQAEVSPYMWGADAFVLASAYETFSLVAFEGAAASLPLITTRLYGVEEIVRDGVTGYVVERNVGSFAAAMKHFVELSPAARRVMGSHARSAAIQYNETNFVKNWRAFYGALSTVGLEAAEQNV